MVENKSELAILSICWILFNLTISTVGSVFSPTASWSLAINTSSALDSITVKNIFVIPFKTVWFRSVLIEYIGLTESTACWMFISVCTSSIISIYFGAVNVIGDSSPTLILITWFSGNIENEINQTRPPNIII